MTVMKTDETFCCNEMSSRIANGDVSFVSSGGAIHLYFRGSPRFVGDGVGGMDDITEEYLIRFCPFCGKKLEGS
jgi:hypothetical protein